MPRRKLAFCVMLLGCGLVGGHLGYGLVHQASNRPAEAAFADGTDLSDSFASWDRAGARELCCEHSASLVAGAGGREGPMLAFHLCSDDPVVKGRKRAELRHSATRFGQDYRYSVSVLVPEAWQAEGPPVTVVQWHGVPDRLLGETGRPPPLRILIANGAWHLVSNADSKRVTRTWFTEFAPDASRSLWSEPVQPGGWVRWDVAVRWSFGDDGHLEVRKDGVVVAALDGANAYNDAYAPYLKIGIYVPRWDVEAESSRTCRTLYFDDVLVSSPQGQPSR